MMVRIRNPHWATEDRSSRGVWLARVSSRGQAPSRGCAERLAAMLVVLLLASACGGPASVMPRPPATVVGVPFTPGPASATPQPTIAPSTATATALLPTATASPTPEPATLVTNELVNVRRGPATTYAQIGQLAAGATATVTGRNDDSTWWQIAFDDSDDGKGWVFGELVSVNATAAGAPVVPAP